MLHYELSKSYLEFLLALPFKERSAVLWQSQTILSMAGGYLKMKVFDYSDELSIFRVYENTYLLVLNNYTAIRLIDGAKSSTVPEFKQKESEIVISKTIKDLVSKDETAPMEDELTHYLKSNYFTSWFIKLLSYLPKQYRDSFAKKEVIVSTSLSKEKLEKEKLKKEEIALPKKEIESLPPTLAIKKPIVKQAIFQNTQIETNNKKIQKTRKANIDGAQYEKMILLELQEAYQKRLERKKEIKQGAPFPKLKHVRFAPKETLISTNNKDDCLELLMRKTKQNGCRLSDNDWLILLTNTIDDNFAKEIESRYPNHVTYTDDPNKGELRIAFIVKIGKKIKEEIPEIKRIKSKTANFTKEMPSGAFENVDDEDYLEAEERHGNGEIRRVKSKVAIFTPQLPETSIDEFDDFDFNLDEDGFLMDEEEPNGVHFEEDSDEIDEIASPTYPKHWHCYLCGKKKLFSGEPAETVRLANGKIVYLCAKHRGKM